MNYINEVYKNICIKEDKSILRDYLYYLYIYESLSNKKLSALLNLPVPIVCAIKKEFIKFEIVKQDRGINLGLSLFMRCTILGLKNNFGKIFISYGEKDNFTSFEIQKLFFSMNFLVKNIINNFNSYFGAGVIGGRSNMIILESLPYENVRKLNIDTCENIYTGNVNKKNRHYQCTNCKKTFILKENMFIEELKENGCSCGNKSFRLLKRTKA
jgi:predicted methyltransferase